MINATFTDGGTLTGFVDFNIYDQLGNYDLVTSPALGFTGFEFQSNHGNIAGAFLDPGHTQLSLLGPTYDTDNLNLTASATFTASQHGNSLLAISFECQGVYTCPSAGVTRYLSGPSLMGVPEPATWALMMIGLGGIGAAARRRQRATATA